MVSGKERMKIARQMDDLISRINRQRDAITRILDANMAMTAALLQIANMEGGPGEGLPAAVETAQTVLAVVAGPAAAAESEARDLLAEGDKEETNG